MKKDRFLTGILIFIGFLVILAVSLFFLRDQGGAAYKDEDSPEGILNNYALALQNMEFPRAYGYLAEREYKPTYEAFRQAFLSRQLDTTNTALQIGAVHSDDISGDAWVEVTILYAGSGLFDSGWNSSDRATLVLEQGEWKITFLPYPYWGWDWYTPTIDPLKAP